MIEQGGASLYDALSLKCSSLLALRIVTGIEGSEVAHFEIWNDKAGDAPPVDSGDGLVFPDLNLTHPENPTSLVMPAPCKFISEDLPLCSIIRPTSIPLAGAMAAAHFLTDTGLFHARATRFSPLCSRWRRQRIARCESATAFEDQRLQHKDKTKNLWSMICQTNETQGKQRAKRQPFAA